MSYILETNTPPPIVIHLDSRFATTYLETASDGKPKTTNFVYVMKEPLLVPEHMNLLVSLHTATIPYSFYNVRSGVNDKIYYNYNDGVEQNFSLTAGNYSATGLATFLKTQLDLTPLTFTISYSRETMKYTFRYSGGTQFAFRFDGKTDGAQDLLGLYTETFPINPTTDTLSTKAIDLNDSIHGLYIRQNIATKGTLDNEEGTFSNILARLPITTNAGGIIFFDASHSDHETMVSVPVIHTIGVKLTDDRNRAIDLNGLHWQISLKIAYIHKEKLRDGQPRRYAPTPTEPIEPPPKINTRKVKKKK